MRLSDAEWVAPLLQAVAEGKTLQVDVLGGGRWVDQKEGDLVGFRHGKENYRIKPATIKYRPALFKTEVRSAPYIASTSDKHTADIWEQLPGFVRWVDDWQEAEI